MMMELQKKEGVFLTLTYEDLAVPLSPEGRMTLRLKDFQDFMKRFRYYIRNDYANIKYYYCGEYGENTFRPHYHVAIFGVPFEYFAPYEFRKNEFASSLIQRIWFLGFNNCSILTPASISYVTKYLDKIFRFNYGENPYGDAVKPFAHMSKGIGLDWFLENKELILKKDFKLKLSDGSPVALSEYFIKKLRESMTIEERYNLMLKLKKESDERVTKELKRLKVKNIEQLERMRHQKETDRRYLAHLKKRDKI